MLNIIVDTTKLHLLEIPMMVPSKRKFKRIKFCNFFSRFFEKLFRFDPIWDATSKKSDLDYYEKMQKLAEGFMKYEGEYFYEAKVSYKNLIEKL